MKLIIAIIQAYDSDRLLRAVSEAGFRATKIVSTGGFLRMGNATVLMGVEDDLVHECLEIIRTNCEPRAEVSFDPTEHEYIEWFPIGVQDVTVGGAVVFIVRVSDFVRIYPRNSQSGVSHDS
ncbi:MAG TPA: cyclic-di-AMP receptor [Thermomicrobiales bacterium]|nr:cyclic-di-AMP receptor [Thermomicrobiales bacterium]